MSDGSLVVGVLLLLATSYRHSVAARLPIFNTTKYKDMLPRAPGDIKAVQILRLCNGIIEPFKEIEALRPKYRL